MNLKKLSFFIKRTNFPKDFEKNHSFFLNVRFLTNFWKTIVLILNEQFHWSNDFTERSFSEKINDERTKWKKLKLPFSRLKAYIQNYPGFRDIFFILLNSNTSCFVNTIRYIVLCYSWHSFLKNSKG